MAKHNRSRPDPRASRKSAPPKPAERLKSISARGWKVITAGAGMVALGFYLLSLTDPAGQNWASVVSPFVILGGYAVIGGGIVLPDPEEAASSAVPSRS